MSQETRIVIPARIGVDIAVLASALPLAVAALGTSLYFLIFPETLEPLGGLRIPLLSQNASDLTLTTLALLAVTVWLGARGFGALLRVLRPRPMLVADLEGLRFDPTLCRQVLPWSAVRRIRETGWGRGPHKLTFELRRPIWAIESPLTSRRAHIGGLHLDNGWVPLDLIERLESLRVRGSHDPDAAG